jgi:FemAB family
MLTASVALPGSAEPATAPPGTPAAVPSPVRLDLRWITHAACPADWWAHVERCGGGFFHTPPGLGAGAPVGESVFAQLLHGQDVVGIAAGVRSQCRLGRRARHLYFPTAPALRGFPRPDEALDALVQALRSDGAVEVGVDSFDAGWQPGVATDTVAETRDRVEYLVSLDRDPDELVRRCTKHHRRHLQQGIRQEWSLQSLDGPEARALIATVQQAAADRAAERGDPFHVALPSAAGTVIDGGAPWGVTTFSVWERGAPLAAALVGWTKPRAYYLVGGSTPTGYACHAAVWLHWRIMCHLAGAGFTTYNLGGTPASASRAGDLQHGLYRFKSGFGADVVPCRSVRWTLRPVHVATHRLVNWLASRLHS